jgi:adenylate cyclase
MQRALQNDPDFKIRIGIHIGDVVFDGGDVFGDGVNVASRIEPLAPGGGITISGQVHDTILNRPDIESVFMGAKSLKNVGRPVEVYALCGEGLAEPSPELVKQKVIGKGGVAEKKLKLVVPAAVVVIIALGIGMYLLKGKDAVKQSGVAGHPAGVLPFQMNSVAVLPFADLSALKDQEYFSDGATDAINARLTKFEGLKVISNSAVQRYRGASKGVKEIGKELGTSTVLMGSIQKESSNIVVAAQLVNVEDGSSLWSQTYNRKPEEVFAVQNEISEAIAGVLNVKIASDDLEVFEADQPKDFQAYENYLEGMHLKNRYVASGDEQDFTLAVRKFETAVSIDPDYARAYAGLAAACEVHYEVVGNEEDAELMLKNYSKAASLDPNLAEAHAALGQIYYREGEFDRAYQSLKSAIEISPNVSRTNSIAGDFFKETGLYGQAIKYYTKALERNPFDGWSKVQRSLCFMLTGEFGRAVDSIEKALELEPDNFVLHYVHAKLLVMMKEYMKAEDVMTRMENDSPGSTSYYKALMYAFRGEKEAAFSLARTGEILSLLGMRDEAIDYINNAIEAGEERSEEHLLIFYSYLGLKNTPFYDGLRDDQRFDEIVERQKRVYEERLKKYGDL